MTYAIQVVLTIFAVLLTIGDVAALAMLLSWQDMAPTQAIMQRPRWLTMGMPVVLLAVLLGLLLGMMVLWSPQAAEHLSASL